MFVRSKRAVLVGRITGGYKQYAIKAKGVGRLAGNGQVGRVDRIECAAKNRYAQKLKVT